MLENKKNFYDCYDAVRLFLYVLLLPYLATFVLMVVYMMIGTSINVDIETFTNYLPVLLINAVFMQLCLIVIYFVYNKKRNINFIQATTLDKKPNAVMLAIAICMGFALMWFSSPLVTLFEQGLQGLGFDIRQDLGFKLDNAGTIIYALIALGIIPAFIEELIFRGAILQGLRKYGDWFAIISSALLFMLIHANIQQTIYQFVYGIIVGWLVIKTGSIWTGIIMHAVNNIFVIILQAIYEINNISSTEVVLDTEFAITAVIYTILLVLLLWLGFYLINKIYKKKELNKYNIQENIENKQNVTNYNLSFGNGYKLFSQDKVMLKEGILGVFLAILFVVINSVAMLN